MNEIHDAAYAELTQPNTLCEMVVEVVAAVVEVAVVEVVVVVVEGAPMVRGQ